MRRLGRKLCTGTIVFMLSTLTFFGGSLFNGSASLKPAYGETTSVTRIAGVDQYETAAKIAEAGWPGTSDTVILAAGMKANLVDALAVGPLAAKVNAPILLTDGGNTLNAYARQEIQRLKPKKIYVTSGTAVIKQTVLDELKTMSGVTEVVSLGGYDQYETSVNMAEELVNQGGSFNKIVIAAGWVTPADALSVSSIASSQRMPILMTTKNELPSVVRSYIASLRGIGTDYVIGGPAVVADTVKYQLPGMVYRYAGQDAYETNRIVIDSFDCRSDQTYLANGTTFVDALAGTPLAARTASPILLTDKTAGQEVLSFAARNFGSELVVLGGEAVVPSSVVNQISAVLPAAGSGDPGGQPSPQVTLSNICVFDSTGKAYSADSSGTINLASLNDNVMISSIGVTSDRPATAKLVQVTTQVGPAAGSYIGRTQSLQAGPNVLGITQLLGETGNGLSMDSLRFLAGNRITVKCDILIDNTVVNSLTATMILK